MADGTPIIGMRFREIPVVLRSGRELPLPRHRVALHGCRVVVGPSDESETEQETPAPATQDTCTCNTRIPNSRPHRRCPRPASSESSAEFDVDPKTVARWRKRTKNREIKKKEADDVEAAQGSQDLIQPES